MRCAYTFQFKGVRLALRYAHKKFFSMYRQAPSSLKDLTKSEILLFLAFCNEMTYSDNGDGMHVDVRDGPFIEMCELCGVPVTDKHFADRITSLIKKGFIQRLRPHVYQINPMMVNRGDEESNYKSRLAWSAKNYTQKVEN